VRVPVTWLRSYCDPDLSTEAIAERLDLTGTELERIERVGVGDTANFVVGRVLSAEKHPDADRLTVCEVDDGSGAPRTIVCGAPNVSAGQTVAVARPGAVMPDGTELGEAELRGVRSSGMILAEDEVGLGPDHDGIMVLPDGLAPGAPLQDALPIADEVLELEITPNRPDCLAVYGVAREVHAATGAPLADDPTGQDAEPAEGATPAAERMTVEIADPDICLRFTARVFDDVTIGPSPEWLKQRLSAAGQRPISNVVDITNYVMLCTGQPLHAFDMDRVRGGRIVVRRAEPGERMTTLDDVEREFDPDMALVCDAEGPSGIAGVMGGQISEVSEGTTRVLMEAATWVGPNILKTSKKLGLRSEASTRFEKQLHPEQAIGAQRLAARLMVELCGARMAPGTIDAYPEPLEPRAVALRMARLERLLGEAIPREEVVAILDTLGFSTETREVLKATVPPWRASDVLREADLIEEVARIHGLDRLPTTLPARERAVGRLTPPQRLRRRLEDALRDRGLHEVVAWSFTSSHSLGLLRLGDEPTLELANPLSEDQSVMRPLLLPGLLDAARHNAAHGAVGLARFESGHTYRPAGGLDAPDGSPRGATPATERHHLGLLLTPGAPPAWRSAAPPADFYAAKGLVEALGAAARLDLQVSPATRPFLHPGRSAAVTAGDRELGWIGELHPRVAQAWDLEGAAAVELDADALAEEAQRNVAFRDVTSFPAVLQDIAVVVPADVSAADVRAVVREGGGELLASAEVFDVYTGEQAGEGNRSLALRLEFRAPDRTLTDAEVAGLRDAIEVALERIGGRLRG
jgi:phenylalanyl-tRNA synthetase beta chain